MRSTISLEKEKIIATLLKGKKEQSIFKIFIQKFYQNVSLGYIQSIADDSENILFELAREAFSIINSPPNKEKIHIYHKVFKKENFQALYIHSIDQEFLVKSTEIWLKKYHIDIPEIIHPIFKPLRKKKKLISINNTSSAYESIICILIPSSINLPKNYLLNLQNLYKRLILVTQDLPKIEVALKNILHTYTNNNDSYIRSAGEFLKWLNQGNFVFLGMRQFLVNRKNSHFKEAHQLGFFTTKGNWKTNEFLPTQILTINLQKKDFLKTHLFHISKKDIRSDIYRYSRLETIDMLELDQENNITGILQFIGIFTSEFYKTSPLTLPFLKNKVNEIFKELSCSIHSDDGPLIRNIIDSIPLDEFYYLKGKELANLALGILNMHNKICVFIRPDQLNRSVSVLVYLPKYRYSEELRTNLSQIVLQEIGGKLASSNSFTGDTSFARLIYTLSFTAPKKINISLNTLEEKLLIASQTWQEQFEYWCRKLRISSSIQFSLNYKQTTEPKKAAQDANTLYAWLKNNDSLYINIIQESSTLIVRAFQQHEPLTLGQIMPIFTIFQLKIAAEKTFFATLCNKKIWIHHYEIQEKASLSEITKKKLTEGILAAWNGLIESDPFNELTLSCNLDFKEIVILRAYGRYLKQLGFSYAQKSLADCLSKYPEITKLLLEYFCKRFSNRSSKNQLSLKAIQEKFFILLGNVNRLDHDRILRRYFNIIQATVRTNAFKKGVLTPYPIVSFKMLSTNIIDMPQPIPFAEIFVYSPTMEACHLRAGKIARGGIRWSDRSEDFRSEILGLMKAQTVKNAIILPLGAKGGFVIKNYSQLKESGLSKNQLADIVLKEYEKFITEILYLTDNLIKKKAIYSKEIVAHDQDDPYLVVASDKGTATFSDTANAIAQKYNFWLGDAFASGGSKGYDHKKLAITARGAWIAVRRHFWEIGIDCQKQPITVIGVGDMSGDVFGNGMLQSKTITLIAAFDHRHIFLDPTPNLNTSFKERSRLFNLPESSWEDYNHKLISKGGGVYSRDLKSITITPEVAQRFDIAERSLSPDELISKLLIVPVDLLWFGGIGTFIKSSNESHTQVADRTNDSIRVDGSMIKARIIGEGANLGVTQLGRIEYALHGGRVNMDAIDNSAGVSCSDHEVNLKIMCQTLIEEKILPIEKRDILLASVRDEVCNLVLDDNWLQTLLLTRLELESKSDLNAFISLIEELEKNTFFPLRPTVEFLPSKEELKYRKAQNQGLTRPELAILVSYAKTQLAQNLFSALENTAFFGESHYQEYFPKAFVTNYDKWLYKHPLKMELAATVFANKVINIMGPCFINQITTALQINPIEAVRSFLEILEATGFETQLKAYNYLDHDSKSILQSYQKTAQTITQCVLLKLQTPHSIKQKHLKRLLQISIPYVVGFAHQLLGLQKSINLLEKNYHKLSLSKLWDFAAQQKPSNDWERSAWIILQCDLIKTISHLCSRDWSEQQLNEFIDFFTKYQHHVANLPDASQGLLLLDYIVKHLKLSFLNNMSVSIQK